MCEYFVKADPISYEQRARTLRIRGVSTSIRLENMVWDILAEMAEDEGCTTNALISKFHSEILEHRGEVPNFASFLRITCMRYLRRCLLNERRRVEALQDDAPRVIDFAEHISTNRPAGVGLRPVPPAIATIATRR